MIRGVVRKGRTRDAYHTGGRRCLSRNCVTLFAVAWARCDDHMFMPELARDVSLLGEMASNSASALRVELRDIEGFQELPPAARSPGASTFRSTNRSGWRSSQAA